MNKPFEQEIRFRLLQILSRKAVLSQRDMAKEMGISLGKVNYCVTELAKKGFIKIVRFKSAKNKVPYTYILTPRGIQEKVRLTARFLRQKIDEYEEIEKQIGRLADDLNRNLKGNEAIEFSRKECMDLLNRIRRSSA